MALVQYPQITGDGLGNAPRPPLRLGAVKWKNASGKRPGRSDEPGVARATQNAFESN
jgi:hypothetical protein